MARAVKSTSQKKSHNLLVALSVAGVTLFAAGSALQIFGASHTLPAAVRDAALLLLAIAAIRHRSLTFWIFVAMLQGSNWASIARNSPSIFAFSVTFFCV